ncbi:YGL176C [Zygosaccharomyces parabailii]|nr:YGL176C [Zygosaccharomyces parabailii]CDH16453.1 uncharacterized protein ZBAI_08241 [Zygosaccharomyces bailii ISA1307]
MPPELPGFYYDEERGRYFRVFSTRQRPSDPFSSYDIEEVKKRKVNQEQELELHELSESRSKIYQDYLLQLSDPFQRAFGSDIPSHFIEGLKIQDSDFDDYSANVNSSFGSNVLRHEICSISLLCDLNSDEESLLIFATRKGLVEECVRENLLEKNLCDLSSFQNFGGDCNFHRLTITDYDPRVLYFHASEEGSNTHFFGLIGNDKNTVKRQKFKQHENVCDSVNLGEFYVVAVGRRLRLYSWKKRSVLIDNPLDNKVNSDILTLAIGKSNGLAKELYVGCRDGSIYIIPIGPDCSLEFTARRRLSFANALSIISIKTTETLGIIFVSAVGGNKQVLFMLDTLMDNCKPLVKFQTTFLNLTKTSEIFDVSTEGHYICYGSLTARNGKGDVEIFSSYLQDNLKYERLETMVFYPLRSLSREILQPLGLKDTKLCAAGLGRQPRYHHNTLPVHGCRIVSCRLYLVLEETSSRLPETLPRLFLVSTDM